MDLLLRRRMMMTGTTDTYDAEVEYLESTGYEGIDCGFIPTSDIQFTIDIYRPTNAVKWDCGAEKEWNQQIARLVIIENNQAWWRYGSDGVPITGSNNLTGDLRMIVNKGGVTIENETTGITYNNGVISSTFTSVGNFILFGFWYGGYSIDRASAGVRLKAARIIDSGVDLDLIPVRRGQVGYMYDKISGRLFGNIGTGAFLLGPDIL